MKRPRTISRRRFLRAAGVGAAGFVTARTWAAGAEPSPARPNFVVILSEAQGWTSTSVPMDPERADSRGPLVQTPNLERLAAQGIRFSRGYASSPRCTPSRAALLTGKTPAQLHMTFVNDDDRTRSSEDPANHRLASPHCLLELPTDELTVAEALQSAGYACAHFGKWHVGRVDPSAHGFDASDGPTSNRGPGLMATPNPGEAHGITERGIDFVRSQVRAGRPFYLQLSHYSARNPDEVSPQFIDAFTKRTGENNPRVAAPCAGVEEMDATIGTLLAALDDLGIQDSTYVFYTSDHGTQGQNANRPLTGGKGTLWEGGIRVPIIARGPGIRPGTCCAVPAVAHDLFPTLAELARLDASLPPGIEGGSWAAVLANGGVGTVRRPSGDLVFHFPHYDHDERGPGTALVYGNHKLVLFYETGVPLLFDIANDMAEQNNLAPNMPGQTAAMLQRMRRYLESVRAQLPAPNPAYDPARPSPPRHDPPTKPGKPARGQRKERRSV